MCRINKTYYLPRQEFKQWFGFCHHDGFVWCANHSFVYRETFFHTLHTGTFSWCHTHTSNGGWDCISRCRTFHNFDRQRPLMHLTYSQVSLKREMIQAIFSFPHLLSQNEHSLWGLSRTFSTDFRMVPNDTTLPHSAWWLVSQWTLLLKWKSDWNSS